MKEDQLKELGVSEDNIPKIIELHTTAKDLVIDEHSKLVTENTNKSINGAVDTVFKSLGVNDFQRNEGEKSTDYFVRGINQYITGETATVKDKQQKIKDLTDALSKNSPEDIRAAVEEEITNKYAKDLQGEQDKHKLAIDGKDLELSNYKTKSLMNKVAVEFDKEKIKTFGPTFNMAKDAVNNDIMSKYDIMEVEGKVYGQEKDSVKRTLLSELLVGDERLKPFLSEKKQKGVGSTDTGRVDVGEAIGDIEKGMIADGFDKDISDLWTPEFMKRSKKAFATK